MVEKTRRWMNCNSFVRIQLKMKQIQSCTCTHNPLKSENLHRTYFHVRATRLQFCRVHEVTSHEAFSITKCTTKFTAWNVFGEIKVIRLWLPNWRALLPTGLELVIELLRNFSQLLSNFHSLLHSLHLNEIRKTPVLRWGNIKIAVLKQ